LVLILQPGSEFIRAGLPIVIGVLMTVVIGEIFINHSAKKLSALKQAI